MPPLDRTHNRSAALPYLPTLLWAFTSGPIVVLLPVLSLANPGAGGGDPCQDAERSCSHLGTMVEFAVALGSKLDVINKHSFNNFRLRVGERLPTLLGTEVPPLPTSGPSLAALQLTPRQPLQTHFLV